jgi:hypothetical protein
MDPQLKAQLRQIASYAVSSATANVYGEVGVGSVATVYCRLESRIRSMEKTDGTFQATRQPLLVLDADGDTATPTFETKYWLPGISSSTAGLARHPKFIEVVVDEYGAVQHWELEF